jgi:hypothetical protein
MYSVYTPFGPENPLGMTVFRKGHELIDLQNIHHASPFRTPG